jgi:chemotaxis protein histidine kinase CheA/CheY-like chemotaxis protein
VVSANLEDGIRELRLMPLQPFFREYAQVVREVARECGKQATLAVRAEGAEIDRGVLLRLREPLLHMVRNAVVHGIEPQEQRLAAGKPEAGRVSLEARAEGNRVIIRVCDDGGGIDLEGVRRRAAALHLLDGSKELNDEALLDVLSHPGFSTRQRTDGMAGRGIGLDVARSSIHGLGGRLSLDGHSSAGTTFTIEVPITASTSIGLLVRVQEDLYGVLLNQIDRVLRASPEDVKVYEGRDTVLFQDEPVAAISLAELLGLPVPAAPPGRRPAVVLRQGKQRLLLFVDDIPGEQALVIKPLGRAFAGARLFLGGAVQADHSIVPVLQVPELFERAAARQRLPILPSVRSPARSRRGAVLVVDDSLTIRTLLRNILLAAGYQVTLAHDGESALQELARLPHCDLIITDLQMPGMDGSALCRAVRGSHQPHLPILIVTSVGADEEKRKALAAGADAYMIKSEFEQGHFLATVAQMTSPSSA